MHIYKRKSSRSEDEDAKEEKEKIILGGKAKETI